MGLAVAKAAAPYLPAQTAPYWVTGITLGAMLPDIDMYPTALAFLAGKHDWVYLIHRSATHSLLLIAVLALAGALFGLRSPTGQWTCFGLSLGVATHVLLDAFFWFAPLDLFWPLSHLPPGHPLLPILNLWSGAVIPSLWLNLRDACEFAASALFLLALRRISVRAGKPAPEARGLKRWEIAAWIAFAVGIVGAFLFVAKPGRQVILVEAPLLLAFMPYSWLAAYREREAIAVWCQGHSVLGTRH